MSELHDKARSFAAYLAKGLGLTESSYVIRDLLAENERLLTDLQQANVTTLKAINQRMDAEARLRALCEQEPLFLLHAGSVDYDLGEQDEWETEANGQQRVDKYTLARPGQTIPLIPRPSMEGGK